MGFFNAPEDTLLNSGLEPGDPLAKQYRILKEIGHGAFGNVFKAINRNVMTQDNDDDQYVAIKKILFDRNYVQREVPILAEITSKGKTDNIIRLIDRYLKTTEEKK